MRARGLSIAVALAIGIAALSDSAHAGTASDPAEERQQLLVAVEANDHPLSEGVDAIGTRDGKLYLPLGEIARLLEFDISVNPDGTIAQGRGNASSVSANIATRSITTSRGSRALDNAALFSQAGEIFARMDILEELLGVTLHADLEALSVTITSKDRLPFELALERKEKREQLKSSASFAPEDLGPIKEAKYQLISPPAFDVRADLGVSSNGQTGRAELRAGGDLLFAGYQLFLGTDSRFRPQSLRLTLDRRDFEGGMFGPLGVTRIAAGDVFTPSLPVGPRSFNGRGIFLSSEPLQRISIFDKLDLRGELPAAWDVELYVNEALSGSQQASATGEYEFLNVPLVYGRNVIRLRFYGPQGEHREEVRHFNVEGGQLREGEFVYNFGVIADGHPLIRLAPDRLSILTGNEGFELAANARYGLTRWLTLTAGLSSYRPVDERIAVATIGARAALGAYSVQLDGALDQQRGGAIAAAIAGPLLGGTIVARHAEYAGNFIDQTGSGGGRPLKRSTDVRANAVVRWGKVSAPVNLLLDYDVLSDGTPVLSAQLQTTLGWNNKRVSVGLGYSKTSDSSPSRLLASTDAYLVGVGGWQIRGGATTRIAPHLGLDSLQLSVDRPIGDNKLLRLGATRAFSGFSSTSVDGSLLVRTGRFDLSLNGSYNLNDKDFRIGTQLSFGLLYDSVRHRYALSKPGAATAGALALNAFNDLNGDGVRQPREPGIEGLMMQTGSAGATTDKNGYAFAGVIGNGMIPVRITGEQSVDPMAVAEDMKFRAAARPGRTIRVDYPVALLSEVQVRAFKAGATDQAKAKGVSALRLLLVSSSGKSFAQTTAYDGIADFTDLRPGKYRVEIEKDQAEHLGVKLLSPVTIIAPPEGGVLSSVDVQVAFGSSEDAP